MLSSASSQLRNSGDNYLNHRLRHALHPLNGFVLADGKRQMARTQTWVAILLDVQLRPAEPTRKKHVELFFRVQNAGRMQFTDAMGMDLGQCIYQFVKSRHKLADDDFATKQLIARDMWVGLNAVLILSVTKSSAGQSGRRRGAVVAQSARHVSA